jgi:catechol 2,3-dioxygenase-like lactoylglutathione lyase family enzyme
MPNRNATNKNELPFRAESVKRGTSSLSARFKLRICFFFFLSVITALAVNAQVPRPKIYSLAFVRLKATDMEKSNTFYDKFVRLKSGYDDCHGISDPCYSLNPYQHIELSQIGSKGADNFVEVVGFNVSDVEQMRKYLTSRGLQPTAVARGANGLRFIEVDDPEGHRIAFVELSGADAQTNIIGQVSDRLIHAGFIVKDRAREDKFYQDLLGFRPYWHGGMKDDETTWVSLQVPDGSDWLEYMLYDAAGKDKHFLGVMNHIALGVTDIQAAKAQLVKNGAKLTEEPKLGRDGKWQLNVYDPDETRVEFMEFAPKEKPCCSEFTAAHPNP